MAKQGRPFEFSEEERAFLEHYYPIRSAESFCKEYEEEFGKSMSKSKLSRLVAMYEIDNCPTGYFTIGDVAKITGLAWSSIYQRVKRKTLYARKFDSKWYIPMNSAHDLLEHYTTIPDYEVMSGVEAAQYIGYCPDSKRYTGAISKAFNKGQIDGYKFKGNIYLKKTHIIAAGEQMKRTGFLQVQWRKIRQECGE